MFSQAIAYCIKSRARVNQLVRCLDPCLPDDKLLPRALIFSGLGLGHGLVSVRYWSGLGLAQWSCLHVIEANSDAVSNRSTDAHRDL